MNPLSPHAGRFRALPGEGGESGVRAPPAVSPRRPTRPLLSGPPMRHFLDFEKPIAELEGQIEELRRTTDAGGIDVADEIGKLRDKAEKLLAATYAKLSPWQKAQVARHPDRPKC